ncbi:Squamosa promoter-binding-like protein 15 [Chlorella vulgaris]
MATPAAPEAGQQHASTKARGSTARCQICELDLSNERIFFRRYRACPQHVHADQIQLNNVAHRFCQQCGRFHSLDCFDGDKRSCREQLAQHAARRRYLYRLRHSSGNGGGSEGGGTPAASGGCGGGRARSTTSIGVGLKSPAGGSACTADSEGEEQPSGSSGPAALMGFLSRPASKRMRGSQQHEQQDHRTSPQGELPLPLPLPPLMSFQNCPASWQSQGQGATLDVAPVCSQPQQSGQWQRTDSCMSSGLQLPIFWQRADSGKPLLPLPVAGAGGGYQRTDSDKSSQHRGNLLEAAAAAVAAATVAELGTPLGTPRSVVTEHAQQWLQYAAQATPCPSPQPSAELSQQQQQTTAAQLNQWVDEQLQRRQTPAGGSKRQRVELSSGGVCGGAGEAEPPRTASRGAFSKPSPVSTTSQLAAACGSPVDDARVPPPAEPQRDVQQLWEQLWSATQPQAGQLAPQQQPQQKAQQQAAAQRVIWRPVPQRVRVLAPSLCAAVAAGRVPLSVAASQAQPLASLLSLLQQATGPLQPHDLVKALERAQPPPVLVAVPAASAAPPLLLPRQEPAPEASLLALLSKYAPLAY